MFLFLFVPGLERKNVKKVKTYEYLFFRYVRLNDVNIVVSARGFPYVSSLTSFSATLKPFVASRKIWTWTRLVEKVFDFYNQ